MGKYHRKLKIVLLALGLLLFAGCSVLAATVDWPDLETIADSAVPEIRLPSADGTEVYTAEAITLDTSNKNQGYIMVRADGTDATYKLRIIGSSTTYTYDLTVGDYETFPLQCGSGVYSIRVLEHVEDDLYSPVYTLDLDVELDDELLPYLYPSQIVNYGQDSLSVKASYALSADLTENRSITDRLYSYVTENISYDDEKAASVKSGYLPDPDETLLSGKGICYDFSALLAAMLRSHDVPTRLIVGYVSSIGTLHAWNQVYLNGKWVWYDAVMDGSYNESDYAESRRY